MKDAVPRYSEETKTMVRQVLDLQTDRVQAYRAFEMGHKAYMETKPDYDFISFREVVNNATQEFDKISRDIIHIEQTLREAGVNTVADDIRTLQDLEQQKLRATVEKQLAKQMVADCDPDTSGPVIEKEKELQDEIYKIIDDISCSLSELRDVLRDE